MDEHNELCTRLRAVGMELFRRDGLRFTMQQAAAMMHISKKTIYAVYPSKEALLLAVNRKVVILIPLCFVLTHFLGFKGVYLSEGIADLVAGIVTAIVIFTSFPKIFRRREEEVKQAASN